MTKAKLAELFPFKEYQVTLRNKNVVLYVHNVTIYGTKCFTTDFRISLQNHKSQHKKKQQSGICLQQRIRSDWAAAQSD